MSWQAKNRQKSLKSHQFLNREEAKFPVVTDQYQHWHTCQKYLKKFCAKDQTIIFPKTTCWVSSSTVCVKNIPFHRPYRLYGILLQNSMIKLYVVQFSLSRISLSFGQSFHTADKTWALRYDVRGSPFKLIRSYLSNRKQYVQVRSKTPHHL